MPTRRPISLDIRPQTTLSPTDRTAVHSLVVAATDADGLHPLSEHVMLHLRSQIQDRDRHFLAWSQGPDGEELVGYAHLDPTDAVAGASGELVVAPPWRRQGVGRQLAEQLDQEVRGNRLRLWAHGEHAGARGLATAMGYVITRELWQLRRSLRTRLPELQLPPGYRVRTFDPQSDGPAWLAVNAAAFANHREQGGWTLTDLEHRMAESWFDPAGFFLFEDTQGQLAAFHWTKVHAHDTSSGTATAAHEPLGEVYVVAVAPEHSGRGLGTAATLVGLRHLRSQGLAQAMLYVDADNSAAVHTYERLGFTRWDVDVQYSTDR